MTFFIFDPSLTSNSGHHSTYCRLIVNELRQRNVNNRLYANIRVARELIDELAAIPCFERSSYHSYHHFVEPVAGWLNDFDANSASMLHDLELLEVSDKRDIFYFNSMRPAQFNAVVHWMKKNQSLQMPKVFGEFGTDPGIDLEFGPNGERHIKSRDPRIDPRSVLYRYAASQITPEIANYLTLFTFETSVSAIYANLIQHNVATFPWPHVSTATKHVRGTSPKLTVAFLGHQRFEKGYQLVPSIVRHFSQFANMVFLIHNSAPYEMYDVQKEVRELTNEMPQIRLTEIQADGLNWKELLDQSDIIVCPYDPIRYSTSHSAIVVECIANGIPVVVPARTVLASMAREYSGMATEFEEWTPQSIADAIIRAVAHIDDLGVRSHQASLDWSVRNGVSKLVDSFLG